MRYFRIFLLHFQDIFAQVLQGLVIQLVWSLVLFVIYRKVWNAGIKKYSAVGQSSG